MNWHQQRGGGGAIDLVMHLAGVDYRAARRWLATYASVGLPAASPPAADPVGGKPATVQTPGALRLPLPAPCRLARVRQYLTRRRGLDSSLLETLFQSGQLYADGHANAVFVLVAGKTQRPVGAELRGTGPRVWRGMASGSNKDRGYFWIGTQAAREIVLCESAIDAISCFQIHPHRICISTSGVRAAAPSKAPSPTTNDPHAEPITDVCQNVPKSRDEWHSPKNHRLRYSTPRWRFRP